MLRRLGLAATLLALVATACNAKTETPLMAPQDKDKKDDAPKKTEAATLGGGCFWCIEAVYQEVKGVVAVESGYCNGTVDKPTYVQVHDPTTLNAQGNDHGTQYRSGIYTHDEEQKKIAEQVKKDLDASGAWKNPIVTEILPVSKYSKAEDYHQNYFRQHPGQGYCKFVIAPKMDKFRKAFEGQLQK